MAVPFIDLRRFEDGFLERWAEISARISAQTQFVAGPEAAKLEAALADRAGVPAVVGCANGTDALQLALRARGVGAGDTVIIPDATFWATFEAVVNVGARVVTVDIDPSDLQMDFGLFRRAVDAHQPAAAILVHLYGWGSASLDEFRAFCRERGLPLIEDAAQAFGVEWRERPIFAGAELATISFYPAKVLGSCGDAGAVYCRDPQLATTVRQLGNHGRTAHYGHGLVGWNSRLGGFDAAYLNLCLEYVDERLESRRRAAARYREGLGQLGIPAQAPPAGYLENGYLSVALAEPDARPGIEEMLRQQGIGFGNVYPGAMSKQPGAAGHLLAS
ncbi:MAG: aminotransferase class I/II-fold pyridoxal phosphate-dependent enzyme, partial [Holophagales bacterium]|nr:aminotransferase class I/II-fold pyridoxal phosphate-dependent enzyme [Holophagales bacterium]